MPKIGHKSLKFKGILLISYRSASNEYLLLFLNYKSLIVYLWGIRYTDQPLNGERLVSREQQVCEGHKQVFANRCKLLLYAMIPSPDACRTTCLRSSLLIPGLVQLSNVLELFFAVFYLDVVLSPNSTGQGIGYQAVRQISRKLD